MQGKEEIQASSGNQRKRGCFCLKLVTPSLPKWVSREPKPLDTAVWPTCAHVMTFWETLIPGNPASQPLPWPGPAYRLAGGRLAKGENPVSLCGDGRVILGSRLQGPGWRGAGANLD